VEDLPRQLVTAFLDVVLSAVLATGRCRGRQ
jgi:hypothetical protein